MSSPLEKITENDVAKIVELVEALEKSSFDFLSLEVDALRLTIGKGTAAPDAAPGTPPVAAPSLTPVTAAAPAPSDSPGEASPAVVEDGLVAITATTMGHFYSRPEPSAPPFVKVGDRVEAGATIGLIELMKLFNSVTSDVSGTIVEICVEDAQLVEFGQVLMRVRPEK